MTPRIFLFPIASGDLEGYSSSAISCTVTQQLTASQLTQHAVQFL